MKTFAAKSKNNTMAARMKNRAYPYLATFSYNRARGDDELMLLVTAPHQSHAGYVQGVVIAGGGYAPCSYATTWEKSKLRAPKDVRVNLTIQDPIPTRET